MDRHDCIALANGAELLHRSRVELREQCLRRVSVRRNGHDTGRSGGYPVFVRAVPVSRSVRAGCRELAVRGPAYTADAVVVMDPDWHAMEKLYVFGDAVRVRGDGSEVRSFPTIREIARRFRIKPSTVGDRASRDKWVRRRAMFQDELRKVTWQKLMAAELSRSARS